MTINKLVTVSLKFLVLGMLTLSGGVDAADDGIPVGVQIDQKAPDFTLSLLDGDDEDVVLYEQVQKYDVVVLNFFIVSN